MPDFITNNAQFPSNTNPVLLQMSSNRRCLNIVHAQSLILSPGLLPNHSPRLTVSPFTCPYPPHHRQLPPEERQALLPAASPAQGAGDEPIPQRPGVPGAGQPNTHAQPHAQPQEQEQGQRRYLGGGPLCVTPSVPPTNNYHSPSPPQSCTGTLPGWPTGSLVPPREWGKLCRCNKNNPLQLPFSASRKRPIFHQKQACACVNEGLLSWIYGILGDIVLHVCFLSNFMQHVWNHLSAFVAFLPAEGTDVGCPSLPPWHWGQRESSPSCDPYISFRGPTGPKNGRVVFVWFAQNSSTFSLSAMTGAALVSHLEREMFFLFFLH